MSDQAIERVQYGDGPWANTGSDSCVNVAGQWHFPGPDVSRRGSDSNSSPDATAVPSKADQIEYFGRAIEANEESEVKGAIRITPLRQGFVVALQGVFTGDAEDDLAFTDAVDLAEWLLGWLGVGLECDPDWRSDAYELVDDGAEQQRAEYNKWVEDALEVAEAAQAYFESDPGFGPIDHDEYRLFNKLAKAVKKWRGIEGG